MGNVDVVIFERGKLFQLREPGVAAITVENLSADEAFTLAEILAGHMVEYAMLPHEG